MFSVPAWFRNENGRYYRPFGVQDNHATTLVFEKEGEFRQIFDSYADNENDPTLKEIEWDLSPMIVKRFWIKRKSKKKENIFVRIFIFLKNLFKWNEPEKLIN